MLGWNELQSERPAFQTEAVTAWRDATGTLWVRHRTTSDAVNPWDVASITPDFAEALIKRRRIQGRQIIRRYGAVLRTGTVLDYGCGHGAFLAQLLAAGVDAAGCDIGVPLDLHATRRERFHLLDEPWAIPQGGPWTTVVLLDVLEHHSQPVEFVRALGAPNLLIKVPLKTGPIGLVARLALRSNRTALMETLLLVGDVSPHLIFFTAKGLDTVLTQAGYVRKSMLRQADVGLELPKRIRGGLAPSNRLLSLGLSAGGSALAAVATIWSDTATFHYVRQ